MCKHTCLNKIKLVLKQLPATTQHFWILQAYYRYLSCEKLMDFSIYGIVVQLDINSSN